VTPDDRHPQADEAARYVLGQLPPAARHEFEVQLTQSAELRALVQELEEGVEAMAHAMPQRPPPPQCWENIEQAIAREVQRKVITLPIWSNWLRNGWVAAAACLLAFLSYAWWPQRKENPPDITPSAVGETEVVSLPEESGLTKPAPVRPEVQKPTNVIAVAASKPMVEAISPELASLRWQVAALQSQLEKLSEVVSQQKAVLTEPGRFKFFPLANSDTGTEDAHAPALSPNVQHAISYAMARDLGWLPRTTPVTALNNNAAGTSVTTVSGIDFVEFTKSQNTAMAAAAGTQLPTEETGTRATTPSISVRSNGKIPGYLGKELVMALDPTILPRGSTVEFWRSSSDQGQQLIGSTMTSDNPMVVTMSTEGISGDLTITASQTPGTSNPIGHFYIVRHPQPEGSPNQSP